ncbi:hypothetical protein F2Q70_00034837 [Brassica cretica]|uniref:Ubiquinol oxidase n=1 Tax=Brassica cretica TaxID=69181 RepID=A0A8S9JWE3_BRACR|nr:hypothetical protein F2Q70_00034837 [Brassica cretica]
MVNVRRVQATILQDDEEKVVVEESFKAETFPGKGPLLEEESDTSSSALEASVIKLEQGVNVFLTDSVIKILDTLYRDRTYPRFFVLETIARVPYFAFMSVLHMYETFGWWRRADYLKVHFAESWNEMHHLLIMEELGGNSWWFDRFLGQIVATFYYFMTVFLYIVSPRMAYHFSECVESHAFETYDKFLKTNGVDKSGASEDIAFICLDIILEKVSPESLELCLERRIRDTFIPFLPRYHDCWCMEAYDLLWTHRKKSLSDAKGLVKSIVRLTRVYVCGLEKPKLGNMVKEQNVTGNTALWEAISKKHHSIFRILYHFAAISDPHVAGDLLCEAVRQNNVEVIEDLLKQGINVDTKDHHGFTALKVAMSQNQMDMVNLLNMNGADMVTNEPTSLEKLRVVEKEKERVSIFRGHPLERKERSSYEAGMLILLPPSLDDLKKIAEEKLGFNGSEMMVTNEDGAEIDSIEVIRDNDKLYFVEKIII